MAETDALASPEPRPYRRVPSTAGVKGSRVQPLPGGTTSRWETSASVGPGLRPRTSIRTASSSRAASTPQPRAVASTYRASASSSPLTDGMATIASSRAISSGKIHPQVGRLLLATHDHGAAAGAGEHLEQQRVGRPAVDDVGALDRAGGRPDARLHLGPHAAGEHAARHETRQVVGIGE